MDILLINNNDEFTFEDIGNAQGFEYALPRVSVEDIGGNQSAVYINSKSGRRMLSWDDVIDDLDNNIQLLQKATRQGALKTIKFTDCRNIALQAEVEIESMIMPYRVESRRKCHIEAVAPDWRFYSQTLHTQSYDVDDETTVNNAGTENTDAIYTITGPADTITINSLESGFLLKEDGFFLLKEDGDKFIVSKSLGSFNIVEAIPAGSTLVIDTKARTVKLDGEDAYSMIEGDFLQLAPGDNSLVFLATGDDSNTSMTVEYRDAYGGI